MPGFTTHYLYGVEMFHQLTDPNIKCMLKRNLGPYRFGMQGPDLFFYNPFHIFYPEEQSIGKLMHETKVTQFFRNYLKLTEKLKNEFDRETAISYFYGFICHYTLDTIVHPYVYFRSNHNPLDHSKKKESFSMHTYVESLMDMMLLEEKNGKKPSKFHQTKTLSLSKREYHLLCALMVRAINVTYFNSDSGVPSPIKTNRFSLLFSICSIKLGTWILHDKVGLKKKLTHFIEHHFLHETIVSNLIENDYYEDNIDANNKKKIEWCNPWDKSLTSNQSVYELIEEASIKFVEYEAVLNDYTEVLLRNSGNNTTYVKKVLSEKKDILLRTLGNLSYHSGLPCD